VFDEVDVSCEGVVPDDFLFVVFGVLGDEVCTRHVDEFAFGKDGAEGMGLIYADEFQGFE
jgi:hypothetical protein